MADSTRLDPITRLILGLVGLTVVLFTFQIRLLLAEALILCLSIILFRFLRPWFQFLKIGLPMVILVFLVTTMATGFLEALTLALRLLVLFSASFLLFKNLPAEDLGAALTRMGVPSWFSFMLITALRYVPFIGERFQHIRDAQRSRGLDLRLRWKNRTTLASLAVPLLIQSFALADDLALAIESRGFGRPGRTSRKTYRIRFWEYVLMGIALTGLVVFLGWQCPA